ncbi:hypothetical protein ES703_54378 [subsurface metagenome]
MTSKPTPSSSTLTRIWSPTLCVETFTLLAFACFTTLTSNSRTAWNRRIRTLPSSGLVRPSSSNSAESPYCFLVCLTSHSTAASKPSSYSTGGLSSKVNDLVLSTTCAIKSRISSSSLASSGEVADWVSDSILSLEMARFWLMWSCTSVAILRLSRSSASDSSDAEDRSCFW